MWEEGAAHLTTCIDNILYYRYLYYCTVRRMAVHYNALYYKAAYREVPVLYWHHTILRHMAYVTKEVKQCVVTLLIYVMPERIQPADLFVVRVFSSHSRKGRLHLSPPVQ